MHHQRTNFKYHLLVLIAMFCAGAQGIIGAEAPPELTIPVCGQPPAIDGRLDDACWKNAALAANFYVVGGHSLTNKHKAWVTRDNQWLYAAFDVAHPINDREPARAQKHDENVQREDNVQITFDPGTDGRLYYQFLVSKANVRADFRMTADKGREREEWNIPWRSATQADERGWRAEIALPFCLIVPQGDLARARFNLIASSFVPIRDANAVKLGVKREITSWSPLNTDFNEPEKFGRIKGLEGAAFKAAFLPFFKNARVRPYYLADGRYCYDVEAQLEAASSRPGKISLWVKDQPVQGNGTNISRVMDLAADASEAVRLRVPVASLMKRTAILELKDEATGELWQRALLDETAALDLFAAFLDRTYYTTEDNAVAVCRIGLPADGLAPLKLQATDAGGRVLGAETNLAPQTHFRIPLEKVAEGTQTVTVELRQQADGALVTQQALELIKRKPKPGCEWKIDKENLVLLDNGQPFLPFGFVMNQIPGAYEDVFKDVAAGGFNSVIHWRFTGRDVPADSAKFLQTAERNKLKVMSAVDLACSWPVTIHPEGYLSGAAITAAVKVAQGAVSPTHMKCDMQYDPILGKLSRDLKTRLFSDYVDQNMEQILAGVNAMKDYPNLVGYNYFEEPLISVFDQQIPGMALYRKINQADGYHPGFLLEIWDGNEPTDWGDCAGGDPYWIPAGTYQNTVNHVTKMTRMARKICERDRKLPWTVPAGEFWGNSYKRALRPEEQRCQTYLVLIHGARAIWYYFYPVAHQGMWATFCDLAREIKEISPAVLAPAVPQAATYGPGEYDFDKNVFPDVQATMFRYPDGKYLLLAANTANYPVDTTFKLSLVGKEGKVTRLFANRVLPVKAGEFSERLEGFDTRAYLIESQEAACPAKPWRSRDDERRPALRSLGEAGTPDAGNQPRRPVAGQVAPLPQTGQSATSPRSGASGPFAADGAITFQVTMTPHPDEALKEVPVALASGRPGQKNVLPNPSFEDASLPGWPDYFKPSTKPIWPSQRIGLPQAVWGQDTNNPWHGKYSLKISAPADQVVYAYCYSRVSPGEPAVLSVYMRAAHEGTKAYLRAGPGAFKDFSLTTDWKCYAIPNGRGDIWIGVNAGRREPSNTVSTIWMDAFQLERGTEPTEFEP